MPALYPSYSTEGGFLKLGEGEHPGVGGALPAAWFGSRREAVVGLSHPSGALPFSRLSVQNPDGYFLVLT